MGCTSWICKAGRSDPATRMYARAAIRLSACTRRPDASACTVATDAMTPAAWSPGSASAGTAMVTGTSTPAPGATVTLVCPGVIQVPASEVPRSAGSRLKEPSFVVKASVP
ncbi:hypothetical protein [Streptodolium elevatio]